MFQPALCCLETYQLLDRVLASDLHFFFFSRYLSVPGFVFAVSITTADSSWRAHAHLTPRPVSEWEGTGRNGSAEGRSNAEIATRLVLQLIKCHVCLVLITPPTRQTWQLLLTPSRLSIIHWWCWYTFQVWLDDCRDEQNQSNDYTHAAAKSMFCTCYGLRVLMQCCSSLSQCSLLTFCISILNLPRNGKLWCGKW